MAHKLKARQIRASWKYTGLGWLSLCGEDNYSGRETWNLIPVTIQIHRNKCNLHDLPLRPFNMVMKAVVKLYHDSLSQIDL